MTAAYAAFPESEHRARLAEARRILARAGIGACVSVAPEHLYYFAGYDSWVSANSPQALIFATDGGEPTLVVRDVDLALPRETSWVADIRTYHLFQDDVPALIASVLREKGVGSDRVAVETQTYALPYALGQALARALAPAAIVDATDMLGALRLVKSPRELDYMRAAAGYARAGLDAAHPPALPRVPWRTQTRSPPRSPLRPVRQPRRNPQPPRLSRRSQRNRLRLQQLSRRR